MLKIWVREPILCQFLSCFNSSFNSLCKGSTRTISQVKNQWSIIKMTKKKLKSDERKKLLQTDGGPPPSTEPEIIPDIGTTSQVINDTQEPTREIENTQKESPAESIASVETACRKQLHEAQMANEERRARNLDLEESLLKVKIDFFRKRTQLLENYK